jgi:hypothetical protein
MMPNILDRYELSPVSCGPTNIPMNQDNIVNKIAHRTLTMIFDRFFPIIFIAISTYYT